MNERQGPERGRAKTGRSSASEAPKAGRAGDAAAADSPAAIRATSGRPTGETRQRSAETPAKGAKADPSEHRRFPTTSTTDPKVVRSFAIEAARLLSDNKCTDIVVLDVTSVSTMSDYILIASGTSDRQMGSTADDVAKLGAKSKYPAFKSDADQRSTWIVVDFMDVVVHIFEPNTRAHYDLEMLWGDAKHVEWERPDQKNRNRAGIE